jgi:class 3 adenylate cyclase
MAACSPTVRAALATIGLNDVQRPAERLERIMPELPSGAVTFLFTDIEGSSALREWDQVKMAAAVGHDQ